MIITETQKKEIERLIPEHREALVAYGADMYMHGVIIGAVWLAIGIGCGFIMTEAGIIYKNWKSKKEHEKES